MKTSGSIVIHLFMLVEIVSFFLFPYMMSDSGLGIVYAAMAGWVTGFITPSVALSHEMVHIKNKKWYTQLIWTLDVAFGWIWPVVIHHVHSHHKYANSKKDYGHPFRNRSRLGYFYSYLIEPLPILFKKEIKYSVVMLSLSSLGTCAIAIVFGWIGLVFQMFMVAGFYFTTAAGNYVQHYGLDELPLSDKDKLEYAWDDVSLLGHYFGFNLHVHSDHHKYPLKPFDELNHLKGKPMVPYGTPILMVLLLLPTKAFYNIMNARLDEYLKRFNQ